MNILEPCIWKYEGSDLNILMSALGPKISIIYLLRFRSRIGTPNRIQYAEITNLLEEDYDVLDGYPGAPKT